MSNKKSTPWIVATAIVVPLGMAFVIPAITDTGVADRKDGIPAVARVQRTGDGSCLVGVKSHHCYGLTLEVIPTTEPAFVSHLDVSVHDRWASRVQPGSLVWVVRNPAAPRDVLLAVEAFAEPAPADPRTTR